MVSEGVKKKKKKFCCNSFLSDPPALGCIPGTDANCSYLWFWLQQSLRSAVGTPVSTALGGAPCVTVIAALMERQRKGRAAKSTLLF